MVTWTVEYENLSKHVPNPDSLLEFAKNVIKYDKTRLNPTLVIEAAQKVGNDIKIPQLHMGPWSLNLVVVSDDDDKKISLWQKTGQCTGAFLPSGLITTVTKLSKRMLKISLILLPLSPRFVLFICFFVNVLNNSGDFMEEIEAANKEAVESLQSLWFPEIASNNIKTTNVLRDSRDRMTLGVNFAESSMIHAGFS
uniref:Putative START-like domain-containing protein n=1 Tax=Tanacetum cinerariifolium TaxID=118510 RepID=A0A6L2L019_TANCI|nr:putative START-like domain-containing protein [Tanacetum cinerariifolium]